MLFLNSTNSFLEINSVITIFALIQIHGRECKLI
jgi:hypothetical protein